MTIKRRTPRAKESPNIDPVLQMFVDQANRHGLEMTITVQVGGILVSGFLTGFEAYRSTIEEQIVSSLGVEAKADSGGNVSARKRRAEAPYFIHMRQVRIWSLAAGPEQGSVINAPVWRGKLASVDGYILGTPDVWDADYQRSAHRVN